MWWKRRNDQSHDKWMEQISTEEVSDLARLWGKVIHWELCKKLKFDHTNKLYMYNPESVLKNEMHKLLWDYDIQTDHLISAWRTDLIIIDHKERTCRIVDFSVPADHGVNIKECEKKDKCLDLAKKLKKLWNMKVTFILIVIGALVRSPKDWYRDWRTWK